MKTLSFKTSTSVVNPTGNWNTAKNFFPVINVDQKTGEITYDRVSRFKRRIIEIDAINYDLVKDAFISAAMHLVV